MDGGNVAAAPRMRVTVPDGADPEYVLVTCWAVDDQAFQSMAALIDEGLLDESTRIVLDGERVALRWRDGGIRYSMHMPPDSGGSQEMSA